MTALSPAQIDTLRNLSRKRAGFETGWVSIAVAQDLTESGLAVRNRSGWEITEAGQAVLDQEGEAQGAQADPVQILRQPPSNE